MSKNDRIVDSQGLAVFSHFQQLTMINSLCLVFAGLIWMVVVSKKYWQCAVVKKMTHPLFCFFGSKCIFLPMMVFVDVFILLPKTK